MTYRLAVDNDSHWYIIPTKKGAEWTAFTDLDSNDEKSWKVPKWAITLGGSPTRVTFDDWELQ